MNTVFLTVISGTVIFVIGQFLQKFCFEPIENWKRILSEIDSNLFIFQNILVTKISDEAIDETMFNETYLGFFTSKTKSKSYELQRECRREMRKLGGTLRAKYNQLPWIYRKFFLKIDKKDISKIVKNFTHLYNSVGDSKNSEVIIAIRETLRIRL